MTDPNPRVVLLSLDGISHRAVTPETMPRLCMLADCGGVAPSGGRCDTPAITYVCHATLATGTFPSTHGVMSNLAATPKPGTVPGWAGQARVRRPTLFEALDAAAVPAAAICGDQHLVQIMGADVADYVWPPGGVLPEGTLTCSSGYAQNSAIREPLLEGAKNWDLPFLFGHFNEADTWGHQFGPDDPATLSAYAKTDALLGEVVDALQEDWGRTVLIVVSDHGMEHVRGTPVDLLANDIVRKHLADVLADGGAALVKVVDSIAAEEAGSALLALPEVVAWREVSPGVLVVEGGPGARFATGAIKGVRGVHGGPGTVVTIAIVGGGHSAVGRIAAAIDERPPHLVDWAPTIAAILAVPFPTAEGRNLTT